MPHRLRTGFGIGAAIVGLTLAGCGGGGTSSATKSTSAPTDVATPGDIPDNQAFVEFMSADGSFHVSVPEGWARTDRATGAEFSDKTNSVQIDATSAAQAPTVSSVIDSELPTLRADGEQVQTPRVVTRSAGEAILVRSSATGRTDPVTGKRTPLAVERYLFWKNGTMVTITLRGAKGADNVDPWRQVTQSFRWSS